MNIYSYISASSVCKKHGHKCDAKTRLNENPTKAQLVSFYSPLVTSSGRKPELHHHHLQIRQLPNTQKS